MNAKAVGKRLQALRRSAGLTQENVAEALGISDNYVSNIETGRDICSMVVLLGMANLYHASMDYILGESLAYNLDKEADGERRAALLHEISRLDEVSCGHLLKYIRLMRDTEQKKGTAVIRQSFFEF